MTASAADPSSAHTLQTACDYRPVCLDLFCGAGGAAMGYHRAGFRVIGVDNRPQPHFPFEFVQADALEFLTGVRPGEYDLIHASPPCQAYSALGTLWQDREHPDLIAVVRSLAESTGTPYVIENVPKAPLRDPTTLCGTMFGLGTREGRPLYRHRCFEIAPSRCLLLPGCAHSQLSCVGVYGHSGGRSSRDKTPRSLRWERCEAMGIDWMTNAELSQAIPPAYTEFIGSQLRERLG